MREFRCLLNPTVWYPLMSIKFLAAFFLLTLIANAREGYSSRCVSVSLTDFEKTASF